jgi:hypothetical protein
MAGMSRLLAFANVRYRVTNSEGRLSLPGYQQAFNLGIFPSFDGLLSPLATL